MVGTRDPQETLARSEPDYLGNAPLATWLEAHAGVRLGTPAEAASFATLIVNATNGAGSVAMLESAGEENLSGKVLVDVANALDVSQGMPPSLFVCNTDSLGEQIQRRFPAARVVKARNTMNCEGMVDPAKVPGAHDVFVCGEDVDAKRQVTETERWLDRSSKSRYQSYPDAMPVSAIHHRGELRTACKSVANCESREVSR